MSSARLPRLHTDWFRVLADLREKDYQQTQVAKIIDVPLSTLRYWKAGGEPAHNYGHALLELWSEVTGKDVRLRPMVFD